MGFFVGLMEGTSLFTTVVSTSFRVVVFKLFNIVVVVESNNCEEGTKVDVVVCKFDDKIKGFCVCVEENCELTCWPKNKKIICEKKKKTIKMCFPCYKIYIDYIYMSEVSPSLLSIFPKQKGVFGEAFFPENNFENV